MLKNCFSAVFYNKDGHTCTHSIYIKVFPAVFKNISPYVGIRVFYVFILM